jgi:hypothetical protein
MPTTDEFIADPIAFCSKYCVLIDEPPGLLDATLPTGGDNSITPMLMSFQFNPFPASPNTAVCDIKPSGTNPQSCYFLPYKPDAAVSMTIGNGANYFFTSMLTGCTVRVYGSRMTPTITHSNAATAFNTAAGGLAASATAAQIQINNYMNPVPAGQPAASVTRTTMQDANTPANFDAAKGSYPVDPNYRIKEFAAKMANSKGEDRPELGMFVYGVRKAAGWEFYYAASTAVQGRQKTGKTYFGFINSGVDNKTIDDGVVLGGCPQFWP